MAPMLALMLWMVCLAALLRFDPAHEPSVGRAMWLPLTWMLIMGSRLPSQWLELGSATGSDAYQEGSLLDRIVFLVLTISAFIVLRARSVTVREIVARNTALALFFGYGLISILWSDFPFITFKRWIRDLGVYLVILVMLTEPDGLAAFRWLLRKFSYFQIPLSILLIKYFPDVAKSYDSWTGEAFYAGATTSKNMLGNVCLITGLFYVWEILQRWPLRKDRSVRRRLALDIAFLTMTLWLLDKSDSATSLGCLLLGIGVLLYLNRRSSRSSPGRLRVLIPVGFIVALILELGLGMSEIIIESLGRDTTLTGRDVLWLDVLRLAAPNAILGVGYETFWLGNRLEELTLLHRFGPNQAHNGYIEVYANLGWTGIAFLVLFLLACFVGITRRLHTDYDRNTYSIAMWCILLVYNVTEAAFKSQLVWFTFLLGAIDASNRQSPATQPPTSRPSIPQNDVPQ